MPAHIQTTSARRVLLAAALAAFCLTTPATAADPPPLMRAKVYHDNIEISRYWVSEKLDGVRAYWDGERLLSRRGKRYNAPPWFTRGFPRTPLDGELWMGRGTFETLSGATRRKRPDAAQWREIRFMVFDLPASAEIFERRLQRLREIIQTTSSPYIAVVEQFKLADRAALMQKLDEITRAGGEGLMLHKGDALYRAGRADDLLKLKQYQDAEAVVIEHLPGKGKFAGMLGALVVETPDGLRFRLGSGFTEKQRQNPPPIGATVTYKHYGKTGNGIPRFASFLRVRDEL